MKSLSSAIAAGFPNADHAKKDTDLDALRSRDDFQKLLAQMEAKKK